MSFEIFLATAPGLEDVLCQEARAAGFLDSKTTPGGVTVTGGWPEVWRANLELRGASRISVRIGAPFGARDLKELDARARRIPWSRVLRADVPVRVEATCRKSSIYHSGAAAERVGRAIREELGAPVTDDAEVLVRARLEHDQCTIGVDTSGELLHKRGHKQEVAKAPMRENLAALFLRQCGYDGGEPVVDPMCGSGTFVIEAAEIAARLAPGRSRRFAFETFATFDPGAWAAMREAGMRRAIVPALRFHGSDRDAAAIAMSRANAERAGVAAFTNFQEIEVREAAAPEGPSGLVIVNPPYGSRIGEKGGLAPLYRALGEMLKSRFAGWRVALVTSEPELARATRLPFSPPSAPVPHGGLRVMLYQARL